MANMGAHVYNNSAVACDSTLSRGVWGYPPPPPPPPGKFWKIRLLRLFLVQSEVKLILAYTIQVTCKKSATYPCRVFSHCLTLHVSLSEVVAWPYHLKMSLLQVMHDCLRLVVGTTCTSPHLLNLEHVHTITILAACERTSDDCGETGLACLLRFGSAGAELVCHVPYLLDYTPPSNKRPPLFRG